jgi:hypothetical protein
VYDAHVQRRNGDIKVEDLVFVRIFVAEPGRSPKLDFSTAGPYAVLSRNDKTFVIQTFRGRQRVLPDRVTRAPISNGFPV